MRPTQEHASPATTLVKLELEIVLLPSGQTDLAGVFRTKLRWSPMIDHKLVVDVQANAIIRLHRESPLTCVLRLDLTRPTGVEGIYALGDVKGGPAFTHISYDDYRIVRDRLLHGATRSTANRLVPYTMFTDPPLARIGLDETQTRASGRDVLVFRLPMTRVARAIETDETRGLIKAVVDAQTGLLLGATVLGIEGGEVMSVLQMAIIGGVTHDQIREAVFAHPTLSESLNNLFMTTPERIA